MKCDTAMITAILQVIIVFRHDIWCIFRRFTTINVELYFLSQISVFI